MSFQQFLSRAASRIGWCATALGLVLIAAVPAQPAAADTTPAPPLALVSIVKATKTVNDYQPVYAECRDGDWAISGGAEAVAPNTAYHEVGLVGSFPAVLHGEKGAWGWAANARNFRGQPTTVTVWAVCASLPRGYEVVQAPLVQVPSDQTVTVSCPAGKTALGGGAEIQGTESSLTKSYPSSFTASGPTSWTVAGRVWSNRTVGVAGAVTCADPIADNEWTTYKVSKNTPSGGFLTCLNGRRVTSGGAAANTQEPVLIASRPGLMSEGADRDGWWIQAGSLWEPIDVDLYVMCRSR
ncbi:MULTISPECIES: hypothetical protein [unclassified Streptomyces]|uniref:hypothetical protein n=1 Tax=unclassified Streptomyces TaxID=2593676 RepID=UPI0037F9AF2F